MSVAICNPRPSTSGEEAVSFRGHYPILVCGDNPNDRGLLRATVDSIRSVLHCEAAAIAPLSIYVQTERELIDKMPTPFEGTCSPILIKISIVWPNYENLDSHTPSEDNDIRNIFTT